MQVYEGKVVRLFVEQAELPDGRTITLEVVRHPGAAAVVPIDDDGSVVLVRQFRHAAGGWLLEVPAGKLDPGESPEDCARREVEEETGLRPERLAPLGWIFTTPGFSDERIWLYAATGLTAVSPRLGEDELLSVERLELAAAVALATDGTIHDAKSVCALLRAAAWRARQP